MQDLSIWNQLDKLIPPEISHFHNQDHPGTNWWLKCALPQSDQALHAAWHEFAHAHTQIIQIRPNTWDWHGHVIPDCESVWCVQHHDVWVHQEQDKIYLELISYQKGLHKWCNQIRHQTSNHTKDDTWHNIQDAIHLIQVHVSDTQALMNRQSLRVIHDKKTTRRKRSRSNLDRE